MNKSPPGKPGAVHDALTDLFILHGPPAYIRSDNGPEFVAQAVRDWIAAVGAKTAYIEPHQLKNIDNKKGHSKAAFYLN